MGSYLDGINSPEDIKSLNFNELNILSDEIRGFLLSNVSQTGGHLASNLGVVELSLCLHKVFDAQNDRFLFDVGHQCYVHKILTGRKDSFDKLRKLEGISGFLRPSESPYDAYVSGHSSNSISIALGLARARTLKGEHKTIVSIIGDGALTGGMAYEALNDAGYSGEPLIVVLNDNKMSIAQNVGAIASYLAKLRVKRTYLRFKDKYREFIKKAKFLKSIDNIFHKIKQMIKEAFLNSSMFEQLGFTYLGPADGHDIKYVTYLLELARELNKPVLIHLVTKKGKGYPYSESDPESFHGIGGFDVETGEPVIFGVKTFSHVFGEKLCEMAKKDQNICAITAAMRSGVGLKKFFMEFPERSFDVGIAEEHAVGLTAGLSLGKMKPFCAIYSTFLQRGYDQLIHDISIDNQNAVFIVDRAGLVGEDGETHHGIFDVAFLSSIPNMKILVPSNFAELTEMLEYANAYDGGPIAIRYPRGGEGEYKENGFLENDFKCIKEGNAVTVISYGTLINNVIEATKGMDAEIFKLNTVNPDFSKIIASVKKTGKCVVVEEVIEQGSFAQKVAFELMKSGVSSEFIALNIGDESVGQGSQQELYKKCGIDVESIKRAICHG